MKFGAVPVKSALDAVLAHSLVAGKRLPKGTVLQETHLQALVDAGFETVVVAQLDQGDVPEDEAAAKLAAAMLVGIEGVRATGAGAGRVNLYAEGYGVIRVNADKVQQINSIDPMITVATVPDYHRVDAGGMVATIKIISYAVPSSSIDVATDVAAAAVSLLRPVYQSATLIETTIGNTPSDKGRRAMAGRVERMGMSLSERVLVAHQEEPLAQAIRSATGDMIFVLTASATSDPLDVAPQALRNAGGQVERFGMPVDPGNLLFLGGIDGKPVIGLPGCARSPALNGADWVLERVICGLEVSHDDIAAMGVGGLLKEIPIRPMPREKGI
ncbi:molybdopterin-binding protein [uncultured Shimia sp.]|uniref:molybdopterin-binding protein n=1 Tax=uncultured Shimia sp. TaxID=573152 RepID=UPI00260449F8|nr:molybdopterin-binding protein [uncultured Shimia sp.]